MLVSGNGDGEPRHLAKEAGFRRDYFDEFVSTMGASWAIKWVDRLEGLLASGFNTDQQDLDALRNSAHSLVAQAGTLGFAELATRSAKLEQEVWSGRPYLDALGAVQREAQRVSAALVHLRAELSAADQSSEK